MEPRGEGQGRKSKMHDREKSNGRIVVKKHSNKTAKAETESAERRRPTKENPSQRNTVRTQRRRAVQSKLARVREAARRDKTTQFTALLHHVSRELLTEAYYDLRRHAAAGVDGVRWKEYGVRLDENIAELHDRIHRGAYRPQPGRRTYIPKTDGSRRALAIAALEDKIAQSAMAQVLNCIYEEEFFGFCYGFRKERSQHDALDALATALLRKRVNWVLDADIRAFFESISHEWMRKFLEHRIGDKRVVYLIMKWLKAGVMEDGTWTESESGSPQGGTISPLLANVFLFYVFDQWAHWWRRKRARGHVVIVRYADDFVIGFEHRADAEQFTAELRQRLSKFELELHRQKTRILEFGRYAAERRAKRGEGKPETFSFLGFTHVCAETRGGRFKLARMTERKRMTRKLHEIGAELKRRMHAPVPEQGRWLQSVIRGFNNYYAVPGNYARLHAFRQAIIFLWRQALRRRSQRSKVTAARMERLSRRWLPEPKLVHPYPDARFDVKHPR